MDAFFLSQFAYSCLASMFYSGKLKNKMNRLYEKCIREVYHDTISSFEELQQKKILPQYTTEISNSWPYNCSEFTRGYFQKL